MKFKRWMIAAILSVWAVSAAGSGWATVNSPEDESRIRAYIMRGKEFYRIKDFQSAIKTWVKVLEMDPLHEEAMELIDDAKFQADYQVAVLDKLEQDRRLKKPYSDELSKMATEMTALLKRAEEERGDRRQQKITSVTAQDAERQLKEQEKAIQAAFDRGLNLYLAGLRNEAYAEWDKILPYLPEGSALTKRIRDLRREPVVDAKPILPAKAPVATITPAAVAVKIAPPVQPAVTAKPAVAAAPAEPVVSPFKFKMVASEKPLIMRASVQPAVVPAAVQPAAKPAAKPVVKPATDSANRPAWLSGSVIIWSAAGAAALAALLLIGFSAAGNSNKRRAAIKRMGTPKKPPLRADAPHDEEIFNPKELGELLKPKNRIERDLLEP